MKDEVQSSIFTEKLDSQVDMHNFNQVVKKEASTGETAANPPLPDNKMNKVVSPLEEEGIIERARKSYEETKILERLARVESQVRRLTIYGSIFCLLMGAFMFASSLLSLSLRENFALSGKKSRQTIRQIIPAQPPEKGSRSLKSPDQPGNPVPQEPKTPASDRETSALPADQESLPVSNTPQEPTTPAVTYVGSITSNKYHYPECKWAKTIIPRKVRVFQSVDEAQKAGCIRCPVCQPPLTDDPEPPTRNDLPSAIVPSFKLGLAPDQPRGPGGA